MGKISKGLVNAKFEMPSGYPSGDVDQDLEGGGLSRLTLTPNPSAQSNTQARERLGDFVGQPAPGQPPKASDKEPRPFRFCSLVGEAEDEEVTVTRENLLFHSPVLAPPGWRNRDSAHRARQRVPVGWLL